MTNENDLKSHDQTATLYELFRFSQIIFLLDGKCHGFVLGRSAMRRFLYLQYWDKLRRVVSNWDGYQENLDEIITLPQQKSPATRREIFNRLIQFIVYAQADSSLSPHGNQSQLLDSNSGQFEFLENGKIYTIRQRCATAGHFTTTKLASLFSTTFLRRIKQISKEKFIFCISSSEHIIEVEIPIQYGSWLVYDPNYDDKDTKGLSHKIFSLVTAWVDEIIKILGNDIILELLYFDERENAPKKDLEIFPDLPLHDLLQGYGFHVIARFAPQQLSRLLVQAKSDTTLRQKIGEALQTEYREENGLYNLLLCKYTNHNTNFISQLINLAKQDIDFKKSLYLALMVMTDNQSFQLLTQKESVSQLNKILKLFNLPKINFIRKIIRKAQESGNDFEQLIALINRKDFYYSSILLTIILAMPDILNELISLATSHKAVANPLLNCLLETNKYNEIGLSFLAKYQPSNYEKIILLFDTDHVTALANVAFMTDKKLGCSLAETLLKSSSVNFQILLTFIYKDITFNLTANSLFNWIKKTKSNLNPNELRTLILKSSKITLHLLMLFQPEYIIELMSLTQGNPPLKKIVCEEILSCDNFTWCAASLFFATPPYLDILPKLLNYMYGTPWLKIFVQDRIFNTRSSENNFAIIGKHIYNQQIEDLITFTQKDPQYKEDFVSALLFAPNNQNDCALSILHSRSSKSVTQLMSIILLSADTKSLRTNLPNLLQENPAIEHILAVALFENHQNKTILETILRSDPSRLESIFILLNKYEIVRKKLMEFLPSILNNFFNNPCDIKNDQWLHQLLNLAVENKQFKDFFARTLTASHPNKPLLARITDWIINNDNKPSLIFFARLLIIFQSTITPKLTKILNSGSNQFLSKFKEKLLIIKNEINPSVPTAWTKKIKKNGSTIPWQYFQKGKIRSGTLDYTGIHSLPYQQKI